MKKNSWLSVLLLFICWTILGSQINNMYLLPKLPDVIMSLGRLMSDVEFYGVILISLYRMLEGLCVSFVCAAILGLLQVKYACVKDFFLPIEIILKTIPTISYVIFALLWLGAEQSVTVVVFLILFPSFYSNICLAVNDFKIKTGDLIAIYPVSSKELYLKLALPMMLPYFVQAISLSFGLGLKVSVMAEIFTQVRSGIGREMNIAKFNLEMSELLALTIVVILICALVDYIFKVLMNKLNHKIYGVSK